MEIYTGYFDSEIGKIKVITSQTHLLALDFVEQEEQDAINDLNPCDNRIPSILDQTMQELEEYFEGKRKSFSIPFSLEGTEFQKKVWKALLDIPYGEVKSYLDIAKWIDNPRGVRAVGNANNKNKISIIIPCHRVIGSNGKLVGYGGGLWRKEWLLAHERNFSKEERDR